MKHVDGEDKGEITLYTLSTCGWCKKTKKLLGELGVGYNYVDVDLLEGNEQKDILEEVKRYNPKCSFPTLVVNKDKCIIGFKDDEIKEALGK
ncbi:MAG: glutaredoxin family protein [Halobacteriota archaeon]|nr:glutaredoxin family protein [Halobacteriota archaeon]MDY6932315.1 glutaredoxin family protein [Halobacteriota archaeon]MDY6959984.1 glutaredoxin family protein [Halobacteriota archaeon]